MGGVVSQSIPNFLNGMSQQTPTQRGINQGADQVNFQNNIVTVSGKYSNAFPEKKFSYIPTENKQALITVSFDLVPSSIYTLITFTPASTNSREITYTVVTSAGTATITQNVTTSWDVGKAQMYDVLARGEL